MAGKSVVRELVTLWGFDIDKQPLRELDAGINTIKSSLKSVGIAVAATAGALGVLLNEAGKQEQVNVAFETIIGDAEKAKETIKDLQEFAAKTPFTIPGIEQNAKQLLGMGIDVNKLLPTLKALGDVSAGLSVPLSRIALNYGQIRTQGRLTGRELRDFAVAGVPLLDTLAKQFGKTTAEVTKMVSTGKVGFADVEKAFVSMTSNGGRFDNLMIKQSKTLKGLISNMQDFGIIFARELGQEILPMAKEIISETAEWLKVNRKLIMSKFKEFLKILVELFKDLISLISTFKTALDGAVGILGGWNSTLSKTFKIFTAIMGLGLLTGIGLVTKAIYGLAVGWTTMGNAALFAQAKMALVPLAIGAIVVAIALIAEDILAFSQGRDSVFGRMMAGLDSIFKAMKEKFGIFGTIGNWLIATMVTPLRAIISTFRMVGTIIDMIMGKVSAMQGITSILQRGLSIVGLGGANLTDSFSNAIGLGENLQLANNQVAENNTPIKGLGGKPFSKEGDSQKAITVSAKNEINLNVAGMNPDDAKELVTTTLDDKLGGMLRETIRDGESQIER